MKNKGITLIALVITIIVLLILAAVSIATLTGENGILSQATNAANKTKEAQEKEQVELAVMSVENIGKITKTQLEEELKKYDSKITVEQKGNNFKVTYPSKNEYMVYADGTVESGEPITVEEAKKEEKFEEREKVQDEYGNIVIIPEGFKIAEDTGEDVTKGIVIEDVENEETKGSQFVWIPVGKVYKNENEYEEITLGRYVFKADGTIDTQLSVTEPTDKLKKEELSEYYFTEGLKDDNSTPNTHAKDIEGFRRSVSKNGGYYIGRYEARNGSEEKRREKAGDDLTQITLNANHFIYNYVTQAQAATLSQGMYKKENGRTFESDLTNSYAWDTAILFVQTFDIRETPYSRQFSLNINTNEGLATKGTNNLSTSRDEICKIWDMASNCVEWTTETYSYNSYPLPERGGNCYDSTYYSSYRNNKGIGRSNSFTSFRPILIM